MFSRIFQTVLKWDLRFYRFSAELEDRLQLYPLARAISSSGDGYAYVLIGILVWFLSPDPGRQLCMAAVLAVAVEYPVYWSLKRLIRRRRPYRLVPDFPPLYTPSDEFSLPSGHAAGGFGAAFLISHFYPPVIIPMYIWGAFIALSRIWLRVHFLSDAVVGALFGTGIAALALWLLGQF